MNASTDPRQSSAAARSEADRGVREPFAALPHSIGGRADVSPTEKAVLLALLFWARAKAVCWPSDRSIGDRIGRSPGTVQRALRRLEGLGLVERRKVETNATGRELVLRWRLTPEAPAREPRQSAARDESAAHEKQEKSKTPRIGREATAAESEGETPDDPVELRRLAECADMPEPIRRMAVAALARLGKLSPDEVGSGPNRDHAAEGAISLGGRPSGKPIPRPIRPVERSARASTTDMTLLPPRAALRRSRPAWLEGMVRQLAGG